MKPTIKSVSREEIELKLLEDLLNEKIPSVSGTRGRVTVREALLLRLRRDAMNGDDGAHKLLQQERELYPPLRKAWEALSARRSSPLRSFIKGRIFFYPPGYENEDLKGQLSRGMNEAELQTLLDRKAKLDEMWRRDAEKKRLAGEAADKAAAAKIAKGAGPASRGAEPDT